MELTPAFLMRMVRETIFAPRAGAAAMLGFGFAPAVGWLALMLMAVASTLLTHLSFAMMPEDAQSVWAPAMTSPVRTAILQWAVLLISVHAIHKIGRWRGGRGIGAVFVRSFGHLRLGAVFVVADQFRGRAAWLYLVAADLSGYIGHDFYRLYRACLHFRAVDWRPCDRSLNHV